MGSVDVAEIYSPHRFSARAEEFQLRPGFAADVVEWKPDGTPWDLTNPSDVKLLEEMLDEQEPALLTGSPPCETFSQLRNISRAKRDPVKVAAEEAAGRHHLHTSIYFYRKQVKAGRIFLHEHPKGASSWKDEEMQKLMAEDGVRRPLGQWSNV